MVRSKQRIQAAIGFTVKSGWAAVVVLGEPATSPRVLDTRKLELSDPDVPEARQPYHAGFGTARSRGPTLSRLVDSVRRFGTQSAAALIRGYRSRYDLTGAGIVVGSLADPDRITNAHIRIHALEGQLFRQVVVDAAESSRLGCCIWRERDLYCIAANRWKQSEQQLRTALAKLPRADRGPWRAEQKIASLAAWLVLDQQPEASAVVSR